MTEKEKLTENASAYMIFGDIDKPFHRPECACEQCEQWRTDNNRPTHKELLEKRMTNEYKN